MRTSHYIRDLYSRWRVKGYWSPYAVSVVIILGSIVLYVGGFRSLLANGVHFLVGVSGFLIYRMLKQPSEAHPDLFNRFSAGGLFKSFLVPYLILLTSASVVAIHYSVRPRIYFLVMIALFLVVIGQSFLIQGSHRRELVILFEICLLYIHLAYSLTLKYWYYFGRTDSLVHANLISRIYDTRTIAGVNQLYGDFPLWHILVTIQQTISRFDWAIWKTMYLTGGLTGIIAILGCYVLASKLVENEKIPIYAALLAATNPTIIFFTSYSIPRSAIMALIVSIFGLLVGATDKEKRILVVLLLISVVYYHPSTPPFLGAILVALATLAWVSRPERGERLYLSSRVIALMGILTALAWLFQSDSIVSTIAGLVVERPSTGGPIRTPSSGNDLDHLFDRQYYGPLLTFVLVGFYEVFIDDSRFSAQMEIFSLLGFGLYFIAGPGPASLVSKLLNNFSFTRWPQYAFPFILLLASVGVYSFIENRSRPNKIVGLLFLVALIGIPLSGYMVAPDNPLIDTERNAGYFTESEVTAFDRVTGFTDDDVAVSHTSFRYYPAQFRLQNVLNLQYKTTSGSFMYSANSLAIYRKEHAHSRSILVRTNGGQLVNVAPDYPDEFTYYRNQVYTTGSTVALR